MILRTAEIAVACAIVVAGTGVLPGNAGAAVAPATASRPATLPSARADGVIVGLVRSVTGAGLSGVCVAVAGRSGLVSSITGAGGRYLITGLLPGRYRIAYRACAQSARYLVTDPQQQITVLAGRPTMIAAVTLRPLTAAVLTGRGPVSGPVSSAKGRAAISGTVREARGKPLAGICVTATSESDGVVSIQEAVTGHQGRYAEPGLSPGKYQLYFAPGCGSSGSYVAQYYRAESNPEFASLVQVGASGTVKGIDGWLEPGGTVTGKVTSVTGQDLSGICVTVAPNVQGLGPAVAGLEGDYLGAAYGSFGVSSHGTYRVTDMAPGSYEVSFSGGCGSSTTFRYAAQWFAPQGGGEPAWLSVGTAPIASINAVLRRAGTVKGVVTDRRSEPVAGVCALAVPLAGQPVIPIIAAFISPTNIGSNARGGYQIRGLAPGEYDVQYSPCGASNKIAAVSWHGGNGDQGTAKPVGVKDDRATGGIDQKLTAGQAIAGRITGPAGTKTGAVCVSLLDTSGNLVFSAEGAANGGYDLPGIAPGSYRLEAGRCDNRALATVMKSVIVRASRPAKGTNVSLPRAGMISGGTAGAVAAETPTITSVSGICVTATPVSGAGAPGLAISDPGSRYQLTGLAPGKYSVTFSSLCPYGPDVYANQTLAAPVSVISSHRTRAFSDMLASGLISGTVTVSGAPAAGVCVLAYPAAGGAPMLAITGKSGDYQLPGLPAGNYAVEFSPGCGDASYQAQWYEGAAGRAAATPVTVVYGELTADIDAH